MICLSQAIKGFGLLRIRTQILIVQLLIMSLVIVILGLCTYFHFCEIFIILQSDAEQQFMMKFIYQSTTSELAAYRNNLNAKIDHGISLIENFNQLNQQLYNFNITLNKQSQRCLQQKFDTNGTIHLGQYCYGIFDCSEEIQTDPPVKYNEMLKLSSLMNPLIPLQDLNGLYFTSISKQCYFSTYPGEDFGNYVPSKRQWFQTHIQNQNKSIYVFSQPYINIFGGIYQTITTSLLGRLYNVIGIVAIDLNFSNIYPKIIEGQEFIVLDSLGRIIISQRYDHNTTEIQSLQNETLFGFAEKDALKIINYHNENDTSCNIQIPNTICVINNNTGIRWYIRKTQLSKEYMLLIMFTSFAYQNYLDLLNETLNKIYLEYVQSIVITFAVIILFCVVSNIFMFFILQYPIEKLINSFNMSLIWEKAIQLFVLKKDNFDQLDQLSEAFVRLATRSKYNKRQKNLSFMQETSFFEYPMNYYLNSKLLSPQTLENLQNLQNIEQNQKYLNLFLKPHRQSIETNMPTNSQF